MNVGLGVVEGLRRVDPEASVAGGGLGVKGTQPRWSADADHGRPLRPPLKLPLTSSLPSLDLVDLDAPTAPKLDRPPQLRGVDPDVASAVT